MPVKHLSIHGKVQRVGFRFHTAQTARQLGVTGWVRNRHDGSVEAMISGTAEAIEKMLAWVNHGPPKAEVTSVIVTNGEGGFDTFETLPTV